MRIFTLVMCLALAGCGSAEKSEDAKEAEEDKETVFDPLVGTLDKANAVEGQLMENKDRTDQAIAESELAADGSEEDSDD